MRPLLLALAAAFLCACSSRSVYLEPSNSADSMVYYYEQDRQGEKHAISSEDLDLAGRDAVRVPSPALVDIDSTLHLGVKRPATTTAEELSGTSAQALLENKAQLVDLMHQLEEVLALTEKAVDAYESGDLAVADMRISGQAEKRVTFLNTLIQRYRDEATQKVISRAIGGGGGLVALRPIFQDELDAIEAGDDAIRALVASRRSSLKIEAFLERPGEEPMALHVPEYDNLRDHSLVARDRAGLNLTEDERTALAKQIKANEDLARTLESVRTKESSIFEGVKRTLNTVAPELAEKIEEAEALAAKLTDNARFGELKKSFKAAVDKGKTDADHLSADVRGKLDGLPDALVASLRKDATGLQEALLIVAEAKALDQRWKAVGSGTDLEVVSELLLDSRTLGSRVLEAFQELPRWIQEAAGQTGGFLKLSADGVSGDVVAAFEAYLQSAAVSDLTENLVAYHADLKRAATLLQEIGSLLGIGAVEIGRIAPDNPAAFDVDLAQARDTLLDLRRIPSKDGDTIVVRTTLTQPGLGQQQSNASFEITHYGWHARLSPSVVLVRPDELASGDEAYRFAPALGWMHHYRPRPEDSGWFANGLRPLEPAVGLHTVFLNFDNSTGIGIGGTISFWNDRLQGGVGVNLSADSSGEGRTYYFIGTDLIGLLQTVGIGGKP